MLDVMRLIDGPPRQPRECSRLIPQRREETRRDEAACSACLVPAAVLLHCELIANYGRRKLIYPRYVCTVHACGRGHGRAVQCRRQHQSKDSRSRIERCDENSKPRCGEAEQRKLGFLPQFTSRFTVQNGAFVCRICSDISSCFRSFCYPQETPPTSRGSGRASAATRARRTITRSQPAPRTRAQAAEALRWAPRALVL